MNLDGVCGEREVGVINVLCVQCGCGHDDSPAVLSK